MIEKIILGLVLAACAVWAAMYLYRCFRPSGGCNCADCPSADCGRRKEPQSNSKKS